MWLNYWLARGYHHYVCPLHRLGFSLFGWQPLNWVARFPWPAGKWPSRYRAECLCGSKGCDRADAPSPGYILNYNYGNPRGIGVQRIRVGR
jgi:hypothetical protein